MALGKVFEVVDEGVGFNRAVGYIAAKHSTLGNDGIVAATFPDTGENVISSILVNNDITVSSPICKPI